MPRLDLDRCRTLFAAARCYRLATVDPTGAPHLVPVTAALVGAEVVFAVDHKPKSTTALRRLSNIAAEPRVAFLADHYDEDWSTLWWVRADATARTDRSARGPGVEAGDDKGADATDYEAAVDALAAKYPEYRRTRPDGVVVRARITRWTGWSAQGG